MTKEILKRYIHSVLIERKELLHEDDGGGDYGGYDFAGDSYDGGGYGGGGSGGMGGIGGPESAVGIFTDPFIRLGKTVVGATKIMASKALMVFQFVKQVFWNTLTPFFNNDYRDIFDKERVRTKVIIGRYQKIFDANRDAIFTKDMWLLTFMLNPSMALGILTVKNASPIVINNVLSMIETLTATYHRQDSGQRDIFGNLRRYTTDDQRANPNNIAGTVIPDVDAYGRQRPGGIVGMRANANVTKVTDTIRKNAGAAQYARQTRATPSWDSLGESLVFEEITSPAITPQTITRAVEQLKQTPPWRAMHQEALGVLQETVNDVVARVERLEKTKTLKELQTITGVSLAGVQQELKKKLVEEAKKANQTLDEAELAKKLSENETALLAEAKNSYKQGRVALLNKFKEHWRQVPEATAIYDRGIQTINNFKH